MTDDDFKIYQENLNNLRQDVEKALSKYLKIDSGSVKIDLKLDDNCHTVLIVAPITAVKRRGFK